MRQRTDPFGIPFGAPDVPAVGPAHRADRDDGGDVCWGFIRLGEPVHRTETGIILHVHCLQRWFRDGARIDNPN